MGKILLQNGVLLVHDENGNVVPKKADLLIDGPVIAKIEKTIAPTGDEQVLDCSDKIGSPGFISTHNHLWQSQLKGRHGNHNLLEYLPTGNAIGALYSVEDAFWGQLAGAMESIDAGTTTVVDHSSLNISPEHPPAMIDALVCSGLRAVYCQIAPRSMVSKNPLAVFDDNTPENILTDWTSLVHKAETDPSFTGNGRVRLGFAIDNIYLPTEQLQSIYSRLRELKAAVITTHGVGGAIFGNGLSAVQMLDRHGLLGPDILVSHAVEPHDGDAELYRKHNAFVSSTPNTELQMGSMPIALLPEFEAQSSLGVDCHSWGCSFMPGQMRLLLQSARTLDFQKLAKQSGPDGVPKWKRHIDILVQQAFNLATLGGAKAVGMGDGQLGQLKVGAKADVLIFDTSSPSMVAAAQQDPLTAVVMHSSERDLETVIVDGIVRKSQGKLLPVKGRAGDKTSLTWLDVTKKLLESREKLNEASKDIDWKKSEELVIDRIYMNRKGMVE